MIRRNLWIAYLAGACWLIPASAGAVALVVDRLGTPDVVQAGDTVSFSFALEFATDEVLLATQAEVSAPHLTEFAFARAQNPWDLSATFRLNGEGHPMWVSAENIYGGDAPGVTWDEVGGLAPLGSFSAIAAYNGEIVFDLARTPDYPWVLSFLGGGSVPLDPAWAHYHTGVTIVGGLDLPPRPPPPAVPEPPPAAPPPATDHGPPADPVPVPLLYVGSSRSPISILPSQIATIQIANICRAYGVDGTSCRRSRTFYPVTEDLDPRLHVSATGGLAPAVPEPSTSALMLLAQSLLLALMRRR